MILYFLNISSKLTAIVCLLFLLNCAEDTSREEVYKHANTLDFKIALNENIAGILSNATIQKRNGQYSLNFIDDELNKFISINFSRNEKRISFFENEGPNSFRNQPSYFYINKKNKLVVVSNEGVIYVCDPKMKLKIEQELEISSSLRHQFETNFKSGLQQQNNLVFWDVSAQKKLGLYTLNIDSYEIKKHDIPDNEFMESLIYSEVSEFASTLFPFITIDDQTFIFSTWHSNDIYLWKEGEGSLKDFKIQASVPSIATENLLHSWDKSLKALYSTTHGPVHRDAATGVYVVENYADAQGPEMPALTILDNSGNEVLQVTHESKNRKFWVDGELVELIIDEEKNMLYLNIWKQ